MIILTFLWNAFHSESEVTSSWGQTAPHPPNQMFSDLNIDTCLILFLHA